MNLAVVAWSHSHSSLLHPLPAPRQGFKKDTTSLNSLRPWSLQIAPDRLGPFVRITKVLR